MVFIIFIDIEKNSLAKVAGVRKFFATAVTCADHFNGVVNFDDISVRLEAKHKLAVSGAPDKISACLSLGSKRVSCTILKILIIFFLFKE